MALLIRLCLGVAILLSIRQKADAQVCSLSNYDSVFVAHYFPIVTQNVRSHLRPILSKRQCEILDRTVYLPDAVEDRTSVRSFSTTRTVQVGMGFLRQLVRYQIARTIEQDPLLQRKRISGLYSESLFFVNQNISPELFSELDCAQIAQLKRDIETNCFYGSLIEMMSFVLCHEFYHQVQDYDKQLDKLKKIKSEDKRLKFTSELEISADTFAIRVMDGMGLCPVTSLDCLGMLATFESKNSGNYDLNALRRYVACKFIYSATGCSPQSELVLCQNDECMYSIKCKNLYRNLEGSNRLYQDALASHRIGLLKSDSISAYAAYHFAGFRLKGTELYAKDISLAIAHYKYLAEINPIAGQLYGARDKMQLIDYVEYSRLMLGLFYYFNKHQLLEARKYFVSAAELGLLLTPQHYQALISNCK